MNTKSTVLTPETRALNRALSDLIDAENRLGDHVLQFGDVPKQAGTLKERLKLWDEWDAERKKVLNAVKAVCKIHYSLPDDARSEKVTKKKNNRL